jgi:hypothetical protein
VSLLDTEHVSYCVVGGQAVNAYVEPIVVFTEMLAEN